MPLFEFSCRKCGHQFEELISLSELEDGGLKCPVCKSKRVEKGFSAFATGPAATAGGSSASGGGCGPGGFT